MIINMSYDQLFSNLMFHLKEKYPQRLMELEGLEQTDIHAFSKHFFTTKTTTADASVDENSNVDNITNISYQVEFPKPLFRLNSYFILWKKLKQLYTLEKANDIIEKAIRGDIYINDQHGIAGGFAYSYYSQTSLIVKNKDEIEFLTMKELFGKYISKVKVLSDRETIDTTLNDISVWENNRWVKIKHILRHKTDKKLLKIETKNGKVTIVTSDHPVILEDGKEIDAIDIRIGDKIKEPNSKNLNYIKDVKPYNDDIDMAYLLGFIIGDGALRFSFKKDVNQNEFTKLNSNTLRRGSVSIHQNNISECKAYKIASNLFENNKVYDEEENRTSIFGNRDLVESISSIGVGSQYKKLPNDIFYYTNKAKMSLLAGIIDSDGSVNNRNGSVTIRVTSFALTQQILEIVKLLGFSNIRSSFYPTREMRIKYYEGKKIISKKDLYRVTFRINADTSDIIEYSEKLKNASEDILRIDESHIDGRWESNEVYKIEEFVNFGEEFVYDITTESGVFYCQGLIQHNCFNYSTNDIRCNGLPMVTKIKSVAPKYLYSFKSQVEQFTIIAANSTLGATGLADMLLVMSSYVEKILETGHDANFYFPGWFSPEEEDLYAEGVKVAKTAPYKKKLFEKAVWQYVQENIVSMVYTLNQPARGQQSPFTNVSVYDKYFLESLLPDYSFDGKEISIDIVMKTQDLFLDIMNKELERTPVTFPVTTACFVVDENKKPKDKEFLKRICEKNLKFGFINFYFGPVTALSSCCFKGDEIIEYTNKETNISEISDMKTFVEMFSNKDSFETNIPENYSIKVWNFDSYEFEDVEIVGVLKRKNLHEKLIKITVNGKTIHVTPDHIFKVKEKDSGDIIEIAASKIKKDKHLIPCID